MNSSFKPNETETSLILHPTASGSPEEDETNRFDHLHPINGTYLAGLRFMLQLFYEGASAEEIMDLLLDNHNRHFSLDFVNQVVGGDIPAVTRDQLDETQQLEAEDRINSDIKAFEFILQLNREGQYISSIQKALEEHHGYYLDPGFIWEITCNESNW